MAGINNLFLLLVVVGCMLISQVRCSRQCTKEIMTEMRTLRAVTEADLRDFCQSFVSPHGTKLMVTAIVVRFSWKKSDSFIAINRGLKYDASEAVKVKSGIMNTFKSVELDSNMVTVSSHEKRGYWESLLRGDHTTDGYQLVIFEVKALGCAFEDILRHSSFINICLENGTQSADDGNGLRMKVDPFNQTTVSYTARVYCVEGLRLSVGETSTIVTCQNSNSFYSWDNANLSCSDVTLNAIGNHTTEISGVELVTERIKSDDYNTILSENVDVGNINLEASTPQADKNEGPLTSNIKFILGLSLGLPCFIGIIILIILITLRCRQSRKKQNQRISVVKPSSMLDPSVPSPRHTQNIYNNNPAITISRESVYYVNHSASVSEPPPKPTLTTQLYNNAAFNEVLYEQPEDMPEPMRSSLGASFGASYMMMGDVTLKRYDDDRREIQSQLLTSDTYGTLRSKNDRPVEQQGTQCYYNNACALPDRRPTRDMSTYAQMEQSTESSIYTIVT